MATTLEELNARWT